MAPAAAPELGQPAMEGEGGVDDLVTRFGAVAGAWGAPADALRHVGASVVERHGEAHRRYHTTAHLEAVLDALWVDLAADATTVVLAAWFHDAVYDPRAAAGANEEASAALASVELQRVGAPEDAVAAVGRLVRMTAHHRVEPGDPDAAVLADADLSILAAPAAAYGVYVASVREEYGWLSGPEWRAGRSAVLAGLLERRWLYVTDRGRDRWEHLARANVGGELATLLAQP